MKRIQVLGTGVPEVQDADGQRGGGGQGGGS